jgi:polysaccharide export outer membrane protein
VRELKKFAGPAMVGLFAVITLVSNGCSSSIQPPAGPSDPPTLSPPVTRVSPVGIGQELKVSASPLDQLFENRRTNATDFPIGVGDIIEVTVPGVAELQGSGVGREGSGGGGEGVAGDQTMGNNTVRVDGLGNVNLPLIGQLHVAGLTEAQLRAAIVQRLDKYMYDPQVELFIKSFNSREVAVTGEVHSPGMYIVNGPTETIHDLIIRAGGTTDNAAPKVLLTPSRVGGTTQLAAASAWVPHSQVEGIGSGVNDAASLEASAHDSPHSTYVIDLTNRHENERYLNIPVRPGDTIYVPRAGSVTVIGWVYQPKTIDITPGLTVLSVVSAAGGTLFAADPAKIRVIRQQPGRETSTLVVNLTEIKEAHAPDVLVQANDVIEVPYKISRIPGYALYYGLQGLVTMGPVGLMMNGGL